MAEERVQRRLAAILVADVVGYSRLMGADEAGTLARLKALRDELLQPKVEEYGGRIVKTTGDGTLIEFPSAVDAVQHAVDIQQALLRRNVGLTVSERLELRIGINVGDVIVEGDDLYGDGVNVAARLEGLAEPGGICISGFVHEQIRHRLTLECEDIGEQSLKNIADPVRVLRITPEASELELGRSKRTEAIFRRPAVAVLPFENLSRDPDQEYFADGLTEDIITALSMSRYFPVIARNSSFSYKGQSPDIRRVGEELGARYVIEGSVRKSGERVRITTQLINSETGHHVWAERYDRDLTDIFELQDELTRRIAASVAPELDRAESIQITATRRDLGSWDYLLRGTSHLNELTPEGNVRAREMFQKAIEIEPSNARALALFAHSYQRDTHFTKPLPINDDEAKEQLSLARQAVEFGDTDSMAHVALGIAYLQTGRLDDALVETERALALNPSNFLAHTSTGMTLILLGRPEEAISILERGLQISPQDPLRYLLFAFMSRAHFTAHRYGDGASWARQAIQLRPNSPEPHLLLAVSLASMDDLEAARSEIEKINALRAGYADSLAWSKTYKDPSDNEHFLDALRKAGLPE